MEIGSNIDKQFMNNKEWNPIPNYSDSTKSSDNTWPISKNGNANIFKYFNHLNCFESNTSSKYTEFDNSMCTSNFNESVSTQGQDFKEPDEVFIGDYHNELIYTKVRNNTSSRFKTNPIRPLLLNPEQMIEGYLKGRLCLSCDSISHPMPKCPNQVFVCPNCHLQWHRGENCPERCRFCKDYHPGRCILDCIQETIRSLKLSVNEKKHKNVINSSDTNRIQKEIRDKTTQYEILDPKNFDLTSRSDNAWGRTVYIKGIPNNLIDQEVSNRINSFLKSGYVTKVQLFAKKDHAFVTLSSKLTAAELISKKIVMDGKLLNLQWRKSGGYHKTFDNKLNDNVIFTNKSNSRSPKYFDEHDNQNHKQPPGLTNIYLRSQNSSTQSLPENRLVTHSSNLSIPISLILQGLEMNILTFNETVELVQKLLLEEHRL